MGMYKSLDEAAKTVVLPERYKPKAKNHEVYANYFQIFERLSTKLYEEFEDIANLQQSSRLKSNASHVLKQARNPVNQNV